MTKEELSEYVEEGTILLEPWDTFSKGIIGVSSDRCHVIYDYHKLVESLSEEYNNIDDAYDWLDYNTIRSLPYMNNEYRPIVMIDMEQLI